MGAKLYISTVSARLRISRSGVFWLINQGKLPAKKDPKTGRWVFDADEIAVFQRSYEARPYKRRRKILTKGDQAAECFRCFKNDVEFSRIIMELRLTPEEVQEYYRYYVTGLDVTAHEKERLLKLQDMEIRIAKNKSEIGLINSKARQIDRLNRRKAMPQAGEERREVQHQTRRDKEFEREFAQQMNGDGEGGAGERPAKRSEERPLAEIRKAVKERRAGAGAREKVEPTGEGS